MLETLAQFQEREAKKRAELRASLERGQLADPITIGALVITWQAIAISAAVSAAAALAQYAITRAMTPKPARQTQGKLAGSLQLQNSEQGVFIPEIYGARPGGAAPNPERGGVKVPAIIVWTSGIRKNVRTTQVPSGGGKGGGGRSQTVDNITYDIDLGLLFGRGENELIRLYANADILIDQYYTANPSGVWNPLPADPTYDPLAPPDPRLNYTRPFDRVDGDIDYDGGGTGTGTTQSGSTSFAIYPGTPTQQPDPIIEADVDGKYGFGSTPAYRNHSLIRVSTLDLSRWGGIVPNLTAVWEHATLKTLDTIYASFCERVGVKAATSDYDFTSLAGIASRGLFIAGRPFAPAEVIDNPDIKFAYNYFVTEREGQIVGFAEGTEPSITISDTEIGWLEGESDLPDVLPEIDSVLAAEIDLPREVHVKSMDPDTDWDANTQSALRQVTDGQSVEILEVQLTQLADERRAMAQRVLYQRYVGGTVHKFTLPWRYLYLYPGYKVVINRAEGFTHTIRLTAITGGIGVLECEGFALEPATYTQPANGVFPPGYVPPQPVPAMTIAVLLDTPLLREGDETVNNGVGFYAGGVPRTGVDQTWQGFVLYVERNNEWLAIANTNLPATVGSVASVDGALPVDLTLIDHVSVVTVDLYGSAATLASITELDANADPLKNLAVLNNEVIRFLTATQLPGSPNRWTLTDLYRAQKGTENNASNTITGKRFVLVDAAIVFVPMEISDI